MERTDEIGFGTLKLIQETEEFCYGVDAVLLADFAAERTAQSHKGGARAADLGTNTGIIPLILSYKTDWSIVGLEVQKNALRLAQENRKLNGLEDRLDFVLGDVKDVRELLEPGSFQVVTANPPYNENCGTMVNESRPKMIARHETTAGLEDFIKAAAFLLGARGELFMVHRPSRLVDLFSMGRKYKLEPKEMQLVCPSQGEPANIVLVHFVKNGGRQLTVLNSLNVYGPKGEYTEELLTKYGR